LCNLLQTDERHLVLLRYPKTAANTQVFQSLSITET